MATDNQLKILDAIIFFMSLAVMSVAAILMVGTVSRGLDDKGAYAISGILGLFLLLMVHSALTVTKRGFFMSGVGSGVYKVLIGVIIPEFDGLLFPAGKGEISNLIPPPPPPEIIPALLPEPTPLLQAEPLSIHTPGFIYIMRRDDGIYKLGKTSDPDRRLSEHSEDYKRSFDLIKCFAVPDMTNFERLALRMTKRYSYKKERGRKELRRMTKQQVSEFIAKFGNVVSKTYN